MGLFTAMSVKSWIAQGGVHLYTEDAPRKTGRLALRVSHDRAEWMFQFFANSKRRMIKLGNAVGDAALSLAEAREALKPHRLAYVQGKDPKLEKEREEHKRKVEEQRLSERGTVEQLFREYVDDLRRRGKTSWKAVESALLTGRCAVVDELGAERKAADITSGDIKYVLRKAYDRGAKSMAHHLRLYLMGAFKYGMANEFDYTRSNQDVVFALASNPVLVIPVDREAVKVTDRTLTTDEVKAVWNTLSETGATESVCDALKLIVATGGQRVGEIVGARKSEFDLKKRIWNLPGERTKNSRDHSVPLSEQAYEIISRRIEAGDSEFLFPNSVNDERHMPVTSVNQAVRRYCTRKKVTRWTPKDIRTTVRTMLAEDGIRSSLLDIHLNHGTTVGVGEKHYDTSQRIKDKTVVMARWGDLLAKILKGQKAKVVFMN